NPTATPSGSSNSTVNVHVQNASTSAAVTGGIVLLVNASTQAQTSMTSQGSGNFQATNVPPGDYDVYALASGFTTQLIPTITAPVTGGILNTPPLPLFPNNATLQGTILDAGTGLGIPAVPSGNFGVLALSASNNLYFTSFSGTSSINATTGAYSIPLAAGTYYGLQIVAPAGYQNNTVRPLGVTAGTTNQNFYLTGNAQT